MGKPVSIKGTRQGLVILFDSDAEFEEIKNYLSKKMASARGFFKGAKFTLHNDHKDIPENQKLELENICLQYGLIRTNEKIKLPKPNNSRTANTVSNHYAADITKKNLPSPGEQTLLIKRTLRSGQNIKFNGHVVVMGDVHAGAEIISTGSIIVLGRCSGVVHAGATGNVTALVVSNKLCPIQLRIGTDIVTSPDEEPHYPEVAKFHNGQILVDKLKIKRC